VAVPDHHQRSGTITVLAARMLLLLAIPGVLVAGCAEVSPAPLLAATSADDLEKRTLDDPRLRDFVYASLERQGEPGRGISWDLTTLTLAAVYYHPEIDIARARLALARARVITAGQRPNPVFNLAAMADTAAAAGAIPPGALPLTIGSVINLIIETYGKREARIGEASRLSEAARWDLATAGWQVRAAVRAALLDLWAARQRIAASRHRLDLEEELVRLLERRREVGEASALDVSRERITHAQIATDLRGFERAADAAYVRLATAVGIPVRALTATLISFDAFDHTKPLAGGVSGDELRHRALTGRTDIEAALAEYEAAQAGLQLAVAGQYPNVTLGPGYNYDVGVNKFSLSPAFELPVFNQNQGPIAEALAKRQEAAAKFTVLQAGIIGAIDAAMAAYRAAARDLATADALLADAQRRSGRVAASFRAGEIDRPTLVSAELETAVILVAHVDAVVAQLHAVGALEDALQHPLFGPTLPFSVPEVAPGAPPAPQS
jgi:cobalt-zinc-cadmium efflux system outer membrane protein